MALWRRNTTGTTTKGIDVKNKIVVVLVNDPGLRDSTIFRGKILTYYGRWTYKIEEAQRQGAAGILLVHTTESATYPWTTVQSSWTGPQVRIERAASSLLVAGWLNQDAAAKLFRQGGKDLAALMDQAAQPWLPGGAVGRAAGGHRQERHHPLPDQQRAWAVGRAGLAGAGGAADRRALRPLWHRQSGEWRLDLQRRGGQRVGHRGGADCGGGFRQKRSPYPDDRSSSSDLPPRNRDCSGPRRWWPGRPSRSTASPPFSIWTS